MLFNTVIPNEKLFLLHLMFFIVYFNIQTLYSRNRLDDMAGKIGSQQVKNIINLNRLLFLAVFNPLRFQFSLLGILQIFK